MSKAIAKAEVAQAPVETAGLSIAPMIERIIGDTSLPIERVEQAFAFYQNVQADTAKKAFTAAFAEMQPELPPVERKGKGHNNAKYARWEDIAGAIMPVLHKHGFGLSFRLSDGDKVIRVTAVLSHRDGHAEETSHAFPYDPSGNKNAIQAIGSAKTYGQRYTATALLGIATCDEDDDGKASNPAKRDEKLERMKELAGKAKVTDGAICQRFSVENFDDLTEKQIDSAISGLLVTIKGIGK